jgi:hypothetical protein
MLNTIRKLRQLNKKRTAPKFHAEFIKTSPIITLKNAVLDYTETYNLKDEEEAEETRTAFRDLVSNNLSPNFVALFEIKAEEIDVLFDKEEN